MTIVGMVLSLPLDLWAASVVWVRHALLRREARHGVKVKAGPAAIEELRAAHTRAFEAERTRAEFESECELWGLPPHSTSVASLVRHVMGRAAALGATAGLTQVHETMGPSGGQAAVANVLARLPKGSMNEAA